jgi:hypothetical protein
LEVKKSVTITFLFFQGFFWTNILMETFGNPKLAKISNLFLEYIFVTIYGVKIIYLQNYFVTMCQNGNFWKQKLAKISNAKARYHKWCQY